MKKSILLLFVLLLSLNNSLFSQTCQWAQSIAGQNGDVATSVVTDKEGNVYVSGYSDSDTLKLADKIILNPNKENNIFFAKYSNNGICLWVKCFKSNNRDHFTKTVVDSQGNIFAVGYFSCDTLKFSDKLTLTISDTNEYHNSDGFLAKFTANGDCIWANKIGGTFYDRILNMALDKNNNIVICGEFNSDTVFFNPDVYLINTNTELSNTNHDGFLAKYDSMGNYLWAKKSTGFKSDSFESITIDNVGNLYVSGSFSSDTVWFNKQIYLTNSGESDAFIAKYNTSGDCLSATKIAGELEESVSFLTSDAQNNIYIVGNYESAKLTLSNDIILQGSGEQNCYLSKYDSLGVCKWAKNISGSMDDFCSSISINEDGIIVISGLTFSPTLSFGDDTTVTNDGEANGYFAKYNSIGKCLGAHILSCPTLSAILSSTVNDNNEIFIVGVNDEAVRFNNNISLNNIGGADSFIAKYSLITSVADFTTNDLDRLQIAPNPANNYLTILGLNELSEYSDISVYNTMGERISINTRTLSNSSIQFDVSNLAAGSYKLVLATINGIYSKTFTVVR